MQDQKAYQYWRKWMLLGEKTGCHQKPERSLFIKGYQMPVCARCTGVILGYLISLPCFFMFGFMKILSITGSIVMLIDWLLQATHKRKSTNPRRLVTGIMGGFGIMSMQMCIIKNIANRK